MTTLLYTGLGGVRDEDITKVPASLGQAKNVHVCLSSTLNFPMTGAKE